MFKSVFIHIIFLALTDLIVSFLKIVFSTNKVKLFQIAIKQLFFLNLNNNVHIGLQTNLMYTLITLCLSFHATKYKFFNLKR